MGLETDRLLLRRLEPDDAAFILELVNDPDWHRFIGDHGVQTLDDARRYLDAGPLTMYRQHGHGLNLVLDKASNQPAGLCGLLRRSDLDEPDLGFALLPAYRGRGFAFEAAGAVLEHGFDGLGYEQVVAIANPANAASIGLLERLGFVFDGHRQTEPNAARTALYRYRNRR